MKVHAPTGRIRIQHGSIVCYGACAWPVVGDGQCRHSSTWWTVGLLVTLTRGKPWSLACIFSRSPHALSWRRVACCNRTVQRDISGRPVVPMYRGSLSAYPCGQKAHAECSSSPDALNQATCVTMPQSFSDFILEGAQCRVGKGSAPVLPFSRWAQCDLA